MRRSHSTTRNARHSRFIRRLHSEPLEARNLLAVITVDSELDVVDPDDGLTSLREAISATNAMPGSDEIVFDFGHDGPATILLEYGELEITDSLTISGDGPSLLTIDASGSDLTPDEDNGDGSRVFSASGPQIVTLNGMTLTGGDVGEVGGAVVSGPQTDLVITESKITGNYSVTGGGGIAGSFLTVTSSDISGNSTGGSGGGIAKLGTFAPGSLTITSSTVSGNSAAHGGGGVAGAGTMSVNSSNVSNNLAGSPGGGIRAFAFSILTVTSSSVSGNTAGTGGGGIYLALDTRLTVTSSLISENLAMTGGGGIVAYEATVTSSTIADNLAFLGGGGIASSLLTVTSSTISRNQTVGNGGGISAGTLTMDSSTVSGNVATDNGGGISSHTATVAFSTLSDNRALGAGGIYARSQVEIKNTLIAANIDNGNSPDIGVGEDANPIRATHSLVGDNSGSGLSEASLGAPDANGNLIGDPNGQGVIDPLLSPLGNFGGPTIIHALLPGSPAINMGDPNLELPPDRDQRDAPFDRVSGDRIDMGAFEYQIAPVNFTDDEHLDCADVDAVVAAIVEGNNPSEFDFTGNSLVDHSDLDVWLNLAGLHNLPSHAAYLSGDTNLDGIVDSTDLNTIGLNWRHEVTGWCNGDFTADGVVAADDVNALALNWQRDVSGQPAVANARLPRAPLARHYAVLGSNVDVELINEISSARTGNLNEDVPACQDAEPETPLRRRLPDTLKAGRLQALQHEPSDSRSQRALEEVLAHWRGLGGDDG